MKIPIKILLFFLTTLIIFFSFGFNHIGKFITADEHLWIYDRIPKYWKAIQEQAWEKTYVHEKPGITLSIISGTGLLKYPNPSDYLKKNKASEVGTTQPLENMLATFRIPILIFNALFSLYLFWIIRKITKNYWIAIWSIIFTLLSPIILGTSQIVNADSILWSFSIATLLSFIAYLENNEKKFLILTSLFLGLSMLTKFTATIIIPFLFIVLLIFYLEKIRENKENDLAKKIFQFSWEYFLVIAGSMAVFAILLPASFFRLKRYLYDGTIGYSTMPFVLLPITILAILLIIEHIWLKNKFSLIFLQKIGSFWEKYSKIIYLTLLFIFLITILNYIFGKDFLNLEKIPFDARQGGIFKKENIFKKIILEARPTVFSLTPPVILFCLLLWAKSLFLNFKEKFLILSLSLFVIVYNAALLQQNLLNIIRYNVIIYPIFSILAAIGIYYAIPENNKAKYFRPATTILLIILSLISLWSIKPFYFNYTNFMLPKKYLVTDSWGYGGYEAAQYLNPLPDVENKFAWSDYYGFCDFFRGKCTSDYSVLQNEIPPSFDYFVFTRRGEIIYNQKMSKKSYVKKHKNMPQIKTYYEKTSPKWEMKIGERPENYIKIFAK